MILGQGTLNSTTFYSVCVHAHECVNSTIFYSVWSLSASLAVIPEVSTYTVVSEKGSPWDMEFTDEARLAGQ